ncbi:SWPV1-079 [Shearwaterpox virus]|uniref:SWPV1-079 n=1 Tax=Shearwaterpox virus TaxID=1974596 RepID=A0A1V0S7T4_CNPV|nr:SWPV1-079 [Shearwaterpox virus]
MCFYNLIDRLIGYNNKDKKHKYEHILNLELQKRFNSSMKQTYWDNGVEYEEMTVEEVNTLLRHTGENTCYFGKCSDDLDADIEELSCYNSDEISGLYLKFLEVNYLTFVDISKLDDEVIDHMIYHFMEYLNILKTTILDSRVICKRLLNKYIGKKNTTYNNRIF